MAHYTRKDFIRMSAAAGAALVLGACGANTGRKEEKTEETKTAQPATPPAQKPAMANVKLDLAEKNDPRYDALRQGFNKRIDKHPEVIAVCTTTAEVAAAVSYAREHSLPIAVKSGGHSMEGFSCSDGGMVINLSKMNGAELIGDKLKAGPGVKLGSLYDALLPQGRLLPAGSCGNVGLGGLALGGGYGIFARRYGFTCDHLLEATMVDGKGNVHSTKDDSELLWALKGGGAGNFGIVTEMTFATHEAPSTLQAHYLKARKLTATRAASILHTWMEVTAQLPESCFSGYVLNGSTLNILVTNYDIDNKALPTLLQKLASVVDEFHSSKVNPLGKMVHNYFGRPGPLYFRNSSAGYFHSYDDLASYIKEAFEIIVSTPGMMYQVNTLGGKIKDPDLEKGSCYPHRAYEFLSELQAYWNSPSQEQGYADASAEILKLTERGGIKREYINYCSTLFTDWEKAYYGDNYGRLQAVKRKYDPDNVIRHPQSVRL